MGYRRWACCAFSTARVADLDAAHPDLLRPGPSSQFSTLADCCLDSVWGCGSRVCSLTSGASEPRERSICRGAKPGFAQSGSDFPCSANRVRWCHSGFVNHLHPADADLSGHQPLATGSICGGAQNLSAALGRYLCAVVQPLERSSTRSPLALGALGPCSSSTNRSLSGVRGGAQASDVG